MITRIRESRRRTLARAVTYRIMALITSLSLVGLISGVLVEITKTAIYYVLERAWLHTGWQICQQRETQLRIWTRAIVYRVVATVAVAYWVGIESALVLAVIQTVLFYLNEVIWNRIPWEKTVETSSADHT